MQLKTIVPWGRNLSEYKAMFNLSDSEIKTAGILGCGDGPASFNAEVTVQGGSVVSMDPTYQFSTAQISSRIDEVAEEIMLEVHKKQEDFVWKNIPNPDALYTIRMASMRKFLVDYDIGKEQGRYIEGSLPHIPFETCSFDLVLSSHFLFLYSKHMDEDFHLASIIEMLRVAKEVRIFPLITLEGEKSPYLDGIIASLKKQGYQTNIVPTQYEFQKGGFEMLQITKGER